ncbi:MAG: hypothetical protein MUC60_17000 [Oscillatoria sp. Prado101]|jgi:hypothetical protein|nr:hypothetical protein [Oscillatoria sp. Prado101]
MQELIGVIILVIATFAFTYMAGILGLVFNGLFGVLGVIPEWIWTAALLSLTISVSRFDSSL